MSEIHYHDRMAQATSFEGLAITPTDIDGIWELKNKVWIMLEMKAAGKKMPLPQQIALERLVDNMTDLGKLAILFVCEHNTPVGQDIIVATSRVVKIRFQKKWIDIVENIIANDAINNFIDKNCKHIFDALPEDSGYRKGIK